MNGCKEPPVIDGFEMKAVGGQIKITYMSEGWIVETCDHDDCEGASGRVEEVLREDISYNFNLNPNDRTKALSLHEIQEHVGAQLM